MDSHYDQVMKARQEAQDSQTRLYFAYSTILDRKAFEEWRTEHGYSFFNLPKGRVAEALDVDIVYDFPSRWWNGRVAGLIEKPGSSVFGLLIEIPGADWPIIAHKEGAVTGMCVEKEVRVRAEGGDFRATAFTTHPLRSSQEGAISQMFVEAWLRGAQTAGLPQAYLERIRLSAS